MVKTLDPRYTLPAHTHFIQIEMPKLYGKVCEQVEKEIHTCKHLLFKDGSNLRKDLALFYAVLLPNHYFTPSEAFISKLEDKMNIP